MLEKVDGRLEKRCAGLEDLAVFIGADDHVKAALRAGMIGAGTISRRGKGQAPYFVKAIQCDGEMAWSSPVYVLG